MSFPFKEVHIKGQLFLREFKSSVNPEELIWHLDKEDRVIEVIKGKNWQLQLDNQLPMKLVEGKQYKIEKFQYHRLIKGTGDLVIKLYKML